MADLSPQQEGAPDPPTVLEALELVHRTESRRYRRLQRDVRRNALLPPRGGGGGALVDPVNTLAKDELVALFPTQK